AVALDGDELRCRACATTRPPVCASCGSTKLKARRLGTARAREDLERLAGVAVGEVTGESDALPDAPVLVGTEAVLRRVDQADAPRHRRAGRRVRRRPAVVDRGARSRRRRLPPPRSRPPHPLRRPRGYPAPARAAARRRRPPPLLVTVAANRSLSA